MRSLLKRGLKVVDSNLNDRKSNVYPANTTETPAPNKNMGEFFLTTAKTTGYHRLQRFSHRVRHPFNDQPTGRFIVVGTCQTVHTRMRQVGRPGDGGEAGPGK